MYLIDNIIKIQVLRIDLSCGLYLELSNFYYSLQSDNEVDNLLIKPVICPQKVL